MNTHLDARIEVARGELIVGTLVVPMVPDGPTGEWRVGGAAGPRLRPLRYGERTRLTGLAAMSAAPQASLAAAVARASTVTDGVVDETVREVAALLLSGARDAGVSFDEALLRVGRAGGWGLDQLVDAPADEVDRLARSLRAGQVRLKADPTTDAVHARTVGVETDTTIDASSATGDSRTGAAGVGVDPANGTASGGEDGGALSWVPASAGTSTFDDGGWNRLVFDDGSGTASLTAVRDMLADNLLARVDDVGEHDAGSSATLPVDQAHPDPTIARTAPEASQVYPPEETRASSPLARVEGGFSLSNRWFTRASASVTAAAEQVEPNAEGADSWWPAAGPATGARGQSQPWTPAPSTAGAVGVAAGTPKPSAPPSTVPQAWSPASAGTAYARLKADPGRAPADRPSSRALAAARPDLLGLGAVAGPPSSRPVSTSPVWSSGTLRTVALAPPQPATTEPPALEGLAPDLADALAALLQDEADLRGLE
ncbi:MAG: hypothetical protein U0Q55_07665 [Vicinamibacterales bacterium]